MKLPTIQELDALRQSDAFEVIMACLYEDLKEAKRRIGSALKPEEAFNYAGALILDHWKHNGHLPHALERATKEAHNAVDRS